MAKTKKSTPKPFAAVAAALLGLPPTRQGFEGMITELIEATTQGRLSLMSSGDQAGVDAIGPSSSIAPRRAMQAKRYAEATAFDQNHLLGEMDRAEIRFSGMDCWILASTKTVFGKELEDLEVHAHRKGWGLVILDWSVAGGLPRLATLCAAHRDITDRYLTVADARAELDAVAKNPSFEDGLRQIQHDFRAADVGFESAREAAAAQMGRIFTDRHAARNLAGASPTYLSQAPPVPRPGLDVAIRNWWASELTALALLGDEGMGKTWAALGSLRSLGAEPGGPLVVVIPSPMAAGRADGLSAVVGVLTEAARRVGWSGSEPETFWRRRLAIWAGNRTGSPQPRILVFVDGLDELDPFDWNRWLAPLLDDGLAGLIRIVLACRRDDWLRGARPTDVDKAQLTEFAVGPFEPEERDAYFKSQAIDIDKVARPVLEAALHPRTAFHVVRLRAEIGDLTRITREQILLRDFSNRHELRGGVLDPEAFEQVVIQMARDAEAAVVSQLDYRATSGDVVDLAIKVTGHERGAMHRILSEMVSGGWVQRSAHSPHLLTFTDKSLPLAVGMALAEAIWSKPLDQASAEISRLLEPWGADDLVEPVLRTCAAVLVTRGAPDPLCREVLKRWAGLRFHNREAQDFWRRLHAFKPELFLEMVETGATGTDWLGEWGVASLWEDQPECVKMVEARLQHWLMRIGLPRHRAHADLDFEAMTNRERSRQLLRLKGLLRHGGGFWEGLLGSEIEYRVAPFNRAVRTIGLLPRAAFVPGLVGWAFAAAASGRRHGLKEVSALLRDNPFDWEEAIKAVIDAVGAMIALGTGLGRTAAALLLEATGRPEDAAQAKTLRPRPAERLSRPLLVIEDHKICYQPGASTGNDRFLIGSLIAFSTEHNLELSAPVRTDFDRIVKALPPADLGEWLHGERPLIAPMLRWSRGEALTKIKAFVEAGPPSPETLARGLDYAAVVQAVFPVLSSIEASEAADRIEALGSGRGLMVVTTLRMLSASFSEQVTLLVDRSLETWPERVDALLKSPEEQEYLEVVRALDFAGPLDALRAKLRLMSKVNEHRRPDTEISDFDWSEPFTHEDAAIRALALDLADSIGGEPAARALLKTGWTAHSLEPIAAYEGSAVLGALPDAELEPLVPNLSGENCLRVLHMRPALRDAAENRIWDWVADSLEVRRTSHTMGGTFCHYTKRDEAFAEFVSRNAGRVHDTLARVWGDKRLRSNLLHDDGDGPGWSLLKALAPQQPDFVKELWREAVRAEGGFSFSSIKTFPSALPPGAQFDDARLEMLDDVHIDDRLFGIVTGLQRDGHFDFVRELIVKRLGLTRPYDRAWAMTVAGFLTPTDEAQELWIAHLGQSPGGGWLGEVYEASRRSFSAATNMRRWYLMLGEHISEADAWSVFRLMLLTVDGRYVDVMQAPPFLFEGKVERVRWLNFFSTEEKEARKRAQKSLSDSWLRGPRYREVINGR